jgi:Uma2 family endonuclease
MASLQEYALVDPDTRRIEVFRVGADGLWVLHDMSERSALTLVSVGCDIAMIDVFDGVEPPAAT